MKRFVGWIGVVLFVASMGMAAQPLIVQSVREMGVSGLLDDDGEDLGLTLNGRFGYFVVDGIEVGVYGGTVLRGSGNRRVSLGLFGEYNFDMGTSLVPHAGLSTGYGWADSERDSDSYFVGELWGGMNYFFINSAAIGLDAVVMYATADIYNGFDDSIDWVVRMSTRWFF